MIRDAEYIKSLRYLKDEPEQLPKVLLLGRSNVGKSSFINALTNRKDLARVSKTPGKTLLLNYFLIDKKYYIVDAPGYGYAKRSKTMKDEFIMMLEEFVLGAPNLSLVSILMDFKVGPTKDDIETLNFIRSLKKEVLVILTKTDKVPVTHQAKQMKNIRAILPNDLFIIEISNTTKRNLSKVEDIFDNLSKEEDHEA
ncbi:MAG: ribosome biogenesis GTP-binding protein YihA/YsxC [Acholeplasmataceae bacterium]|jgi:GTP-binding protein|nr:ribosome biogenesis GTP-binding protein YihA/YsxC [Acholeplasmataceae bacterium]